MLHPLLLLLVLLLPEEEARQGLRPLLLLLALLPPRALPLAWQGQVLTEACQGKALDRRAQQRQEKGAPTSQTRVPQQGHLDQAHPQGPAEHCRLLDPTAQSGWG